MNENPYSLWKSIILTGIFIALITILIMQINYNNSPNFSFEHTVSGGMYLINLDTGEGFSLERIEGGSYIRKWTEFIKPLDR